MHTRKLLVGIVATLALALSGCAGDDGATTATDTTDTTATDDDATDDATDDDATDDDATDDGATDDDMSDDETSETDETDEASAEATVAVASSDLGDIVVDGEGRTLYMFVPDEQGEPTCTDDCAEAWPVFEGPASAGEGADEALLGTAEHPSGATQVTYGDWPLYYFANDQGPGDVNGQGVNEVWFVIGPDGEPVRDANASGVQDRGY